MIRGAGLLIFLAAALLPADTAAAPGRAAEMAAAIRASRLDPEQCYRVRDIAFGREDARIYLTEGYLVFARPVGDAHIYAVFSADAEGGDAEILLMPPDRGERLSLASFTKSPALNEHFKEALFVFTDDSYRELMDAISKGETKKSPEMGAALARQWDPTLGNVSLSFSVRLVQDLMDPERARQGFFFGTFTGVNLGNFDLMLDPRARVQMTLGRLSRRDEVAYYDVWCHFAGRSWRQGRRPLPGLEVKLADYRIEASLDQDLRLSAVTKVQATPTQPLNSIPFEIAHQMRVVSATINGQPAEVYQRESLRAELLRGGANTIFLVVPREPLPAGQPVEVEFRHEGNVVLPSGNGVFFVGARGNWYPNRELQFAGYDLTFRYPKALTLVSTGETVEERTEGEYKVVRRKTIAPVRLAGFNLGEYQSVSASAAGYTVDVYANRRVEAALQPRTPVLIAPVPPVWPRTQRRPEMISLPPPAPPNPAARLQELAADIADSMAFFTGILGPAPVQRLTVSPIPGKFGQGFPGLIYLSTLSYLDPKVRPVLSGQQTFFSELLYAHEVSHQWWGNVVTADGYQDSWLMEALANYSALLHFEKKAGARAAEALLASYRDRLIAKDESGRAQEAAGPITWGLRLESSQSPMAWQVITYEKGSWIMHMLRQRLGDAAFQKMLGELVKRFRYQSISTADFQKLAASFLPPKSADPELEGFFDSWVYGTGVPDLKLVSSVKGKAPAVTVTLQVTQGEVEPSFSALAPVEIQTAKGKRTVWVGSGEEAVTVRLPAAPLKVQLDPGRAVLRR
ncbi:MAG: M1 family aminopeptidase [Bryobacteraceae bacterium]|nr:M1 family aminopeptidase [Bryobacteraceae bacterium]